MKVLDLPITVFRCPACRKEWGTYEDANKCTKSHVYPVEIVGITGFNVRVNAPEYVNIKFSDGSVWELRVDIQLEPPLPTEEAAPEDPYDPFIVPESEYEERPADLETLKDLKA